MFLYFKELNSPRKLNVGILDPDTPAFYAKFSLRNLKKKSNGTATNS